MRPFSIYINPKDEEKCKTYDESKCIKLIQKYNLLIEHFSDCKELVIPGSVSCEIGRIGMMIIGSFKEQHFSEIRRMKENFMMLDKVMKTSQYTFEEERNVRMLMGIYCCIQREIKKIQSNEKGMTKKVIELDEEKCYTIKYLIGLYQTCKDKLLETKKGIKRIDDGIEELINHLELKQDEIMTDFIAFEQYSKNMISSTIKGTMERNNKIIGIKRIVDYCDIFINLSNTPRIQSKEVVEKVAENEKKESFEWMNEMMGHFHLKYYENIQSIISYYDLISVNDFELFLNLDSNNNLKIIKEWLFYIQQIQFTVEMIICSFGKYSFKRMPYNLKSMIELSNCLTCILASITIIMITRISSEQTISPSIKFYNLSIASSLQEVVKILIPFTSNYKTPNKKIDEIINQSLFTLNFPTCSPPLYSFERIRLESYKNIIKSYILHPTSLTPNDVMVAQSYAIYLRLQYGFDSATLSILASLDEITTSYEYFGFIPSIICFVQSILPLVNQSPQCALGYAPSCLGSYDPEKVFVNCSVSSLALSDSFNINILLNNINMVNTLSLVYSHCYRSCEFSSIQLMNLIKNPSSRSFEDLNLKDMYGVAIAERFKNELLFPSLNNYGKNYIENAIFPLFRHSIISSLTDLYSSHLKQCDLRGLLPTCYYLEKKNVSREELSKLIDSLKKTFYEEGQISKKEEEIDFDCELGKIYFKSIINIIQ